MISTDKKTAITAGAAVAAVTALALAVLPKRADAALEGPQNTPSVTQPDLVGPPVYASSESHNLRVEVSPAEISEPSLTAQGLSVEEQILKIQQLLSSKDVGGLTSALRELRGAKYELGEDDPRFGSLMSGVIGELIDTTKIVSLQFGARGDLQTAASLVGEMQQLGARDYAPNDLQSYRDFVKFSLTLFKMAGVSPESEIFKAIKSSADFTDAAQESSGENFESVFVNRDSLESYDKKPNFRSGRFLATLEDQGTSKALAYAGDAIAISRAQIAANPRGAIAGLAAVAGAIEATDGQTTPELGPTYNSVKGDLVDAARRQLGGIPKSPLGHGSSTTALCVTEQILEDLNQFGVRDLGLIRQIAVLGRAQINPGNDPQAPARWNALLERFEIDEPSLRF